MHQLHRKRMDLAFDALIKQSEFQSHQYRSERAAEYATHGIGRRLITMLHCIARTFELIPIDGERPDRAALMDATAFLQSFVFNTFGAIDNLAHIWCAEQDLRDKQNKAIHHTKIGLTNKCRDVRASLSSDFQTRLDELDDWFSNLEDFRHSLAHRIPLYIPPFSATPEEADAWQKLQNDLQIARTKSDWDSIKKIWIIINNFGTFEPCFLHSFAESGKTVMLHKQMLDDQATVLELCALMLAELKNPCPTPNQTG